MWNKFRQRWPLKFWGKKKKKMPESILDVWYYCEDKAAANFQIQDPRILLKWEAVFKGKETKS